MKSQPPFSPPLSLLYLASSLETEGHHVDLVDVDFEENPENTIRRILPVIDAAVMNIYPDNLEASEALAQYVHSSRPDLPVIVHGLYCAIERERTLPKIPSADICIQDDAEHTIKEVAKGVEGKPTLSEIKGISYRENNQIKSTDRPTERKNIDDLAFPARHLTKQYPYGLMNGIPLCTPPFTSILTSRGCPFHCRFCNAQFINGPYRQRSAENVLEEFKELEQEYHSVMIADENFLADPRRADKIIDGLIKAGSNLELFVTGARVDTADRQRYQKMAQAGVKFISYGIESGNQEVLDYYRKEITLSQIRNAVDLAREMKFITWGNFIFGAPIETKKHVRDTLKFSTSLPLDMAFYRHLSYQRGSPLWKEAVADRYINEEISFCPAGSNTPSILTTQELSGYCRYAFKRFYYRPTYLFKEVMRCLSRKDFTILRSFLSMM